MLSAKTIVTGDLLVWTTSSRPAAVGRAPWNPGHHKRQRAAEHHRNIRLSTLSHRCLPQAAPSVTQLVARSDGSDSTPATRRRNPLDRFQFRNNLARPNWSPDSTQSDYHGGASRPSCDVTLLSPLCTAPDCTLPHCQPQVSPVHYRGRLQVNKVALSLPPLWQLRYCMGAQKHQDARLV